MVTSLVLRATVRSCFAYSRRCWHSLYFNKNATFFACGLPQFTTFVWEFICVYLKLRKRTNFPSPNRMECLAKDFFPKLTTTMEKSISFPFSLSPLLSSKYPQAECLQRRNQLAIKVSIWRRTSSEVCVYTWGFDGLNGELSSRV